MILLTNSLFYVDMAEKGRSKFAKAAHATRRGKAAAGTSTPPLKRAWRVKEIIVLPPPSPPPTTATGPLNI